MDPVVLEEASSSTTVGGGGGGGGRAIDHHNPIIRDEKRLGQGHIFPSSTTITSATTLDQPRDHHQKKNSKETTKKNLKLEAETGDQKRKSVAFSDDDVTKPAGDFISPETSSRYLLSDKAMFNFSSEFDHVSAPPPPSPPQAPSEAVNSHNGKVLKKNDNDLMSNAPPKLTPSPPPPPPPPPPGLPRLRYGKAFKKKDDDLLSSSQPKPQAPPHEPLMFHNGMAFKKKDDESLSSSPPYNLRPPPALPPHESLKFHNPKALKKKDEDSLSSAPPKPPSPPPSPRSSDQVVILEVSLHCKGCERKMRKHISKIEGVKSFKIEFAAKKVTVVGNVTPLAVLTSVLKVKNAKLLTPATISSSPIRSLDDSDFPEIKKQLEATK